MVYKIRVTNITGKKCQTLPIGRLEVIHFVSVLHVVKDTFIERTLKGVVKKLKSVNVNERWKGAKQHQLCYLHLGLGHFGQTVPFISPCDADVKLCYWKIADMM